MTFKEKMQCRCLKKILRYHTPNHVSYPESYAHHLLILFFPFRNESELLCLEQNNYSSKLNNPDVLQVVKDNKQKFEPCGNLVDEALLNFISLPRPVILSEQQNDEQISDDEVEENGLNEVVDFQINLNSNRPPCTAQINLNILSNDNINILISSLNKTQRKIFNVINTWARKKVEYGNKNELPEPLYMFITGGAGTEKSHLIKTIHASWRILCFLILLMFLLFIF